MHGYGKCMGSLTVWIILSLHLVLALLWQCLHLVLLHGVRVRVRVRVRVIDLH